MEPNKIMYIDLADPLPKSYAPKKGEEMNTSTYSTMRYTIHILDFRSRNIRHILQKEKKFIKTERFFLPNYEICLEANYLKMSHVFCREVRLFFCILLDRLKKQSRHQVKRSLKNLSDRLWFPTIGYTVTTHQKSPKKQRLRPDVHPLCLFSTYSPSSHHPLGSDLCFHLSNLHPFFTRLQSNKRLRLNRNSIGLD